MSAFATAAELQELIGAGNVTEGRAEVILDYASAIIRRFTGQQLSEAVDDEATLPATGRPVVFLPERPVTAISSLEEDGSAFTAFTFSRVGIVRRDMGTWDSEVVAVYDHGYAADSEEMTAIKSVCLNSAARALTMNKAPMFEEFGGGASEAAGFAPELWLSPAEKMLLADFGNVLVG